MLVIRRYSMTAVDRLIHQLLICVYSAYDSAFICASVCCLVRIHVLVLMCVCVFIYVYVYVYVWLRILVFVSPCFSFRLCVLTNIPPVWQENSWHTIVSHILSTNHSTPFYSSTSLSWWRGSGIWRSEIHAEILLQRHSESVSRQNWQSFQCFLSQQLLSYLNQNASFLLIFFLISNHILSCGTVYYVPAELYWR